MRRANTCHWSADTRSNAEVPQNCSYAVGKRALQSASASSDAVVATRPPFDQWPADAETPLRGFFQKLPVFPTPGSGLAVFVDVLLGRRCPDRGQNVTT